MVDAVEQAGSRRRPLQARAPGGDNNSSARVGHHVCDPPIAEAARVAGYRPVVNDSEIQRIDLEQARTERSGQDPAAIRLNYNGHRNGILL